MSVLFNKFKIMRLLIVVCIFTNLPCRKLYAQQQGVSGYPSGLNIRWNITESSNGGKFQISTLLVITTTGRTLPANGWKIYFNFSEPLSQTPLAGITIKHVNGDLFYLAPTADFKTLNQNDSVTVPLLSTTGKINVSDAPDGFYLVWDRNPKTYFTINYLPVKPLDNTSGNKTPHLNEIINANTQLVYKQNKLIADVPVDSITQIFPTPVSLRSNQHSFNLTAAVKILSDDEFKAEANLLKAELSKLLLPMTGKNIERSTIRLIKKNMEPEGYELSVGNGGIVISASTASGAFYGIQSLKAMLPPVAWDRAQKNIVIKGVEVIDKPRFGYRALMLDVARNFQPKVEILKLLDVMALYKLNVLHLHLTDDEGWRLEIPALPELTVIGAKRAHTLDDRKNLQPSLGSGPETASKSGTGYYSYADFIEILKFATARHINIIPEIESPGHARAAIKAMDQRYRNLLLQDKAEQANHYLLHHPQDSSAYTSVQYYNDNVIDVSLPSAYNFIETVTNELIKMYNEAGAALNTIHYGGDEVPAGAWAKSPAFLNLIKKDTTVKTKDDLWIYYYRKVNTILQDHHLYLTGWEEVGLENNIHQGQRVSHINPELLKTNTHLQVWNNVLGGGSEDLAYRLANSGYKVILSCVSNLYLDMAYNDTFEEAGYSWGGYTDVDRMFSFIPNDYLKNNRMDSRGKLLSTAFLETKQKLSETGKANIVGMEGTLWSETLKSTTRMEYMLLPKMLGLAERAWAKDPDWATSVDTTQFNVSYTRAWSAFVNVLGKRELPRLDHYAGGFAYRIPTVGALIVNNRVVANTQFPGFTIRYTCNGDMPTRYSSVYQKPISQKGVIKLRLFNSEGRAGRTVSLINN